MAMRLFTAIELPSGIRQEVRRFQDELKQHIQAGRWQPVENLHLTVHFLGEVDETRLSDLQTAMQAVCRQSAPFELRLGSLGRFGKVLWAGIEGDRTALLALEAAERERLDALGLLHEDKPYRPHITLARDAKGQASLEPPALGWTVEHLALFRSKTLPSGGVHEAIGRNRLGSS